VELPYDVNDAHLYLALNGKQASRPKSLVYRPAALEPGRSEKITEGSLRGLRTH
jgi:hypothetical protein